MQILKWSRECKNDLEQSGNVETKFNSHSLIFTLSIALFQEQ